MPRYIDVDALITEIEEMPLTMSMFVNSQDCYTARVTKSMILGVIKNAPTISPDEVRGVGTWLRKEKVRHNLDGDGDYRYECSACGHSDEHNENVHVPFCWYCGAKMEVSE